MATGLLDLPQDQFMGALDELGIAGARRDELIRAKRNQDSMFGGLFDFFTPQPGMERANLLPMMRPQGMSALDAITSGQAQFAMPGMFTGALTGAAQAIDAPRAAAQGQIPMQDMAGEAANVAGLLTLGGAAAGPGLFNYDPNVAGMGFRAYHGSPHDFDRFSLDKIGTGEGAQAYGHGLYFAENEGIARSYRDTLSSSPFRTAQSQDPNDVAAGALKLTQGDRAAAAQMLRDNLAEVDLGAGAEPVRAAVALLESGGDIRPPGRMYEVQINADPNDFLDWDKPLSEQPAAVRDALGPRLDTLRAAGAKFGEDPDGYALWQAAHPQGGVDKINFSIGPAAQATERLREAGIPGIRYLDAGSRSAGDGSRNYVVFDENLIEIVRKYGIAGAAAMLGVSALDVEQAMAQGQQQPQGLLSGAQ